MRIVVTGGAGFIGANLVRRLIDDDPRTEVTVVDDLSSGTWANLDGLAGVDRVEGSVLDDAVLAATIPGAEAVVHLAARPSVPGSVADPVGTHAHNATGTLKVLDAAVAAGNVHTVLASSSAVYGDDPTPVKHEGLIPRPRSPYAADKLAGESLAQAYQACYGLPTLALRLFNVYGPLQPAGHAYAAVVPAFVDAAMHGRPLEIHGDGRQVRDLVSVTTVTTVLADAVRRRVTSAEPVNVAFGQGTKVLAVALLLEAILGRALPRLHTAARPGDVHSSIGDPTRFREHFPGLEVVPLAQGLAETVDWFAGQAALATP